MSKYVQNYFYMRIAIREAKTQVININISATYAIENETLEYLNFDGENFSLKIPICSILFVCWQFRQKKPHQRFNFVFLLQ